MKRLAVISVLGLFALVLIVSPLALAGTQTVQIKSGKTALSKAECDNASTVVAKQELCRTIWIFVGKSLFSFQWPWIGITVIDVPAIQDLKSDRPADPPPPQFEEEPENDDNGWEEM